jgi:hypothetical protein
MDTTTLSLGEALYLLALDDARGTVGMNAAGTLPYGLTGAVLLDLTLRGRLTFAGKTVTVSDATPTGDDILDDALAEIGRSRRSRTAQHWVMHLQRHIPHHRDRLLARLVGHGILRQAEDRVLGIIPRQRYPEVDHTTEAELNARLRAIALEGAPPATDDALLLSLVYACRLDGVLFSREERKAAKQRAKDITRGDVVGKAVSDAIASVEAGVTAAVVAATSVAATST